MIKNNREGHSMNDKIAAFFDNAAKNWDETSRSDPLILERIAEIAGVCENCSVLDAGCGTGVMFPHYLKRNVREITAVDLSQNMLDEARRKFPSAPITFVCLDAARFDPGRTFDCVTVHNAFPHFSDPDETLRRLAALTSPGGTLTVAHSISREKVLQCHENVPEISFELPEADVLAKRFGTDFENFTIISDETCYIVSAVKK